MEAYGCECSDTSEAQKLTIKTHNLQTPDLFGGCGGEDYLGFVI